MMGYIKQDTGLEVLITAAQCAALGGALPPMGTRLTFEVVLDPSVGMLRADNVQLETAALSGFGAMFAAQAFQPQAQQLMPSMASFGAMNMNKSAGLQNQLATPARPPNQLALATLPAAPAAAPGRVHSANRQSGIFAQSKESFGFIKQDSGEADMFVVPKACTAFSWAFPPVGTRVAFEVVPSPKNGKPMAQNVRPAFSGTMLQAKTNFGFIKQDNGEPDMFVIPQACAYFEAQLPPLGMRVVYEVVFSEKNGKMMAEDVQPMLKDAAAGTLGQLALPAIPSVRPALAAAPPQQGGLQLALVQDTADAASSGENPQAEDSLPNPGLDPAGLDPAVQEELAKLMAQTEDLQKATVDAAQQDGEPDAKRQRLIDHFPSPSMD